MHKNHQFQSGQGMAEYSLVLVAIIMLGLATLTIIGPKAGSVIDDVVVALSFESGSLTNLELQRAGNDGNDVVVQVTVSAPMRLLLTDSQSGQSNWSSCRETCTFVVSGVGFEQGTITVDDGADTYAVEYPAKLHGKPK